MEKDDMENIMAILVACIGELKKKFPDEVDEILAKAREIAEK